MSDQRSPSKERRRQPRSEAGNLFGRIWLVEDDAQTRERQKLAGVHAKRSDIVVHVHVLKRGNAAVAASFRYEPGNPRNSHAKAGRGGIALKLLDRTGARSGLVVAGTIYGSNKSFIPGVRARHFHVAVEVRHQSRWRLTPASAGVGALVKAGQLLPGAIWQRVKVVSAETGRKVDFVFADLGMLVGSERLRAFAFSPGLVVDRDGDLRIGVTSLWEAEPQELIQAMGWIRWIRSVNRRQSRRELNDTSNVSVTNRRNGFHLVGPTRPNISLARRHDHDRQAVDPSIVARSGTQGQGVRQRTMLELFAGAGGLGLGFLLSGTERSNYRLVYSAEVEPIYVQTLRQNHSYLSRLLDDDTCRVPPITDCIDLRGRAAAERVSAHIAGIDRLDVLAGGPPCQGFSSANRNSWSAGNPHNQLVDVFLRYVRKLQPRFVLLENVQGILWTGRSGTRSQHSVADHIAASLKKAGYMVFPKLLDAVWYGVPQHRTRFFLLAIHIDEGYRKDDFGQWGPFPFPTHGPRTEHPYVTVDEAIGDLPLIGNGASIDVLEYATPASGQIAVKPYLKFMRFGAASGTITDHVTSRHARYVIDRYRKIPAGGNWQSIVAMMKNYSALERTHSNIYRRLQWDEPAITIGHYRKSMLVHPEQHRGISLREAARLQSFPDWFRFAGTTDGQAGGLMHKQQQLANAVCPLVSRAIADFLTQL